jgi:hypothetical protein
MHSIRKRYDKLVAARKNHDTQWEDIALYVLPGKADFVTRRTTGDRRRGKDIFDPTAAVSMNVLSSHMHTSLTSPSAPWFELRFKDPEMNKKDEFKEWIEDCTRRMYNAINDSNFVSVINETYKDLITFGTACLETTFEVSDKDPFHLVFKSIPLQNCVFIENASGAIDTVFSEFELLPEQAVEIFGEENLPDVVKEHLSDKKLQTSKYLRVIEPNEKYDPESLKPDARAYQATWLYKDDIIFEEGFYEHPNQVPRWDKITGETYGFGPGNLAYPDIRTLNEAKRLELRSWEKAIDPPMMGMAGGVIGDLHLQAGGYTQVRDTRALAPLHDQANWQATQIKSQELRQNIQSIFLIDQLILPERPNATATEVTIRYEMMQKVLGGTLGRLQAELLNPMVERIFGILFRNGELAQRPEGLLGSEYEIKYTGPMAKAQTANEAMAIERMYNLLMGVGQLDPTVMDAVDMPKSIQAVARQWGVPADVMRSEKEIQELQAQRQQAAEQQAEQQNAMAEAEIAGQQAQAGSTEIANVEALRNVAGVY